MDGGLPCHRQGGKRPHRARKAQLLTNSLLAGGDPPSGTIDPRDLLHRLISLQQGQRDILFLLRSLRQALHNARVEVSPETRRIHRAVVRLSPFDGRCPCCLETKVVDDNGALMPRVEFDHFWGPVYNAPVHSWLICRPCHQDLTNDPHLTWYHCLTTRFRRYQAAVEAYTEAFSRRTPARMYTSRNRPSGKVHGKQARQPPA